MRPNRQPDWDRIKKLALSLDLPGVEEAVSMRQPVLKAHGKLWVWWSPHEDAIVFKVTVEERELLIEAEPDAFFVTPHYRGHPMVLARPEHLDLAWVRANLVRVWREQAPKRVLKAFDADRGPPEQNPRATKRPADPGIRAYIDKQSATDRAICDALRTTIDRYLPEAESKIWHAHPVWFLDDKYIADGIKAFRHSDIPRRISKHADRRHQRLHVGPLCGSDIPGRLDRSRGWAIVGCPRPRFGLDAEFEADCRAE